MFPGRCGGWGRCLGGVGLCFSTSARSASIRSFLCASQTWWGRGSPLRLRLWSLTMIATPAPTSPKTIGKTPRKMPSSAGLIEAPYVTSSHAENVPQLPHPSWISRHTAPDPYASVYPRGFFVDRELGGHGGIFRSVPKKQGGNRGTQQAGQGRGGVPKW